MTWKNLKYTQEKKELAIFLFKLVLESISPSVLKILNTNTFLPSNEKYIYVNLKTGMLNDRYVGIHCSILLKVSINFITDNWKYIKCQKMAISNQDKCFKILVMVQRPYIKSEDLDLNADS